MSWQRSSRRRPSPAWSLLLLVGAGLGLSFPASGSAAAETWRLDAASVPIPFRNPAGVDGVIEASAVEPVGDGRRVLVAHDKESPLHLVDLASGRLIGDPLASPRFPATNQGGPKWEGMGRDRAGNFYLIGSHSGKTDAERATRSVLIRFRLTGPEGDRPAIDDASIVRWDLSRSLAAVLRAQGVNEAGVARRKIEGLAIRETGEPGKPRRQLVVGLREPGDQVRGFAADITADPSPDAELELTPAFSFEAEPREGVTAQLTSLDYVPALGGYLVVTATEDTNNVFHGNTLYFVADGSPTAAQPIATFEVAMKCEGMAVLGAETQGETTRVRLVLTFDNDPHATKIPSRMTVATLVRERR